MNECWDKWEKKKKNQFSKVMKFDLSQRLCDDSGWWGIHINSVQLKEIASWISLLSKNILLQHDVEFLTSEMKLKEKKWNT